MGHALGLIETVGLLAAIEAADSALKSANVALLGMEKRLGKGLVTVKLQGDVGSINAAVGAGVQAACRVGVVYSCQVIPRPGDALQKILRPVMPREVAEKPLTAQKPEENPDLGESLSETVPEKASDTEPPQREEIGISQDEPAATGPYTCNICQDPACPRTKGDSRRLCIHYKQGKSKEDS